MGEPFDLRVVPVEAVVPHEEADPHRVDRLIDRLDVDGRLGNPPVVAELDDERFVLLDGATRMAALPRLGFERVIVQVAAPDGLRLETWSHVVLGTEPDRLLVVLEAVDAVRLDETAGPVEPPEPTMCRLRLVDGRSFAVHPAGDRHPFISLNPFVGAYLETTRIARRIATDLADVADDHPDATAIVVFPRLSLETVFAAAREGHRLPAGITRFLVAGRVIDLNAPLAPLRLDRSLAEHNRWLHEVVAERRATGRIRHYPEAVYVLDD